MKPRTPLKPAVHQINARDEAAAAAAAGIRKKTLGVRVWILVNSKGETQQVEAGKHAIMKHTGLPARDLRILDPLLSYPSTILGRERAIVVNLEHIKAIITSQEVFLLNPKDPGVAPLIADLQRRLPILYDGFRQQVPARVAGGFSCFDGEADDQMGSISPTMLQGASPGTPPDLIIEADLKNIESGMGPKILPFEFRALEVCLEAACSCLEAETTRLEQEAYPALDELTSKISTLNLERVRQIKSKLVAISGRVQKVRDELEQLLDDDGDMAEMYLTDKLLGQLNEHSFADGLNESANNLEHKSVESDQEDERPLVDANRHQLETFQKMLDEAGRQESTAVSRHDSDKMSRSTSSSSKNSAPKHSDVEELEMLLEAYFVQIDGTLNKLSALREYVDDTEDYINIMLDDKQNHLLQMGVMLTTATLVLSGFIVVTGIFGMNIHISIFDTGTLEQFLWVVGGSAAACMFLYILVIGWCRWKRLLE